MSEKLLGVIGGSGLYHMKELRLLEKIAVETPFGDPSDNLIIGEIDGARLAFLPRHGTGHRIPPSEINYRANIFALKKIGVERIISVSAVGSMKEEVCPGHILVPDQFIDHTRRRVSTFFTRGIVGHVAWADPVCGELSQTVAWASREAGAQVHMGGTYICIEGPQFSSRAESNVYRQWGADVIGMTNVTESKLAREAGLCYATAALVTDYDCWKKDEAPVTLEAVMKIMHKNVERAQTLIKKALSRLQENRTCPCGEAAKHAIVTDKSVIPDRLKKDYRVLFGDDL